jgi:hypothetical protein
MDFFPGFKWAVSSAFSDPLGACRFEQGDALYNSPDAYKGTWSDALARLEHGRDIKSPPRAQILVLNREEDDNVFERNWESPVEFDLVHYREERRKEPLKTTQGRLYTFLRTGDFSIFDSRTPPPPVPLLVKKTNDEKYLEAVQPVFVERTPKRIKSSNFFILAIDHTNPVSKAKYYALKHRLEKEFLPVEITISPKEASLKNWESFVPTLNFVAFCIDSNDPEKIKGALKQVLYKPVKKKQPETPGEEPKKKREAFVLRRHGLFIPSTNYILPFSLNS